jgi:enoyl-[acyl-carrier protein] reductase I
LSPEFTCDTITKYEKCIKTPLKRQIRRQKLYPLLEGKKALIMGVANKRSIAWGIAQSFSAAGAEVVLTYQSERLRENVEDLAAQLEPKASVLGPCDVQDDANLDEVFGKVGEQFGGKLDILVHCLAFANREDLMGNFTDTSRAGYSLAQDISSFSLIATAKRARPLMQAAGGGSIITLTYLGAERVVKNYNVMGVAKAALEASVKYAAYDLGSSNIRVNAISAGPIKTLAAAGIRDFGKVLGAVKDVTPLRRNTEQAEVGDTAVFLGSSLSRGITGEVIHVDSGYHLVGLMVADE